MEALSSCAEMDWSCTVATTSGKSAARAGRPSGMSSRAQGNNAVQRAGRANRRDVMVISLR